MRDTTRPVEARLRIADVRRAVATSRARPPAARPGHHRGPLPVLRRPARGRSTAAGTSSSRAPRAPTVDEQTGKVVSGTFRTAAKRLDAVAAMGFDVIYLPPIHPIGEVNRKGRNNTLDPRRPTTPARRGRSARRRAATTRSTPTSARSRTSTRSSQRANELGLEVALDFALQAAPDHPWAKKHPEWFTTRADGTIAYAENPPKKYQDIYPINFDNDPEGIYAEVLRVVRHWMSHGVRIFRVDNPHTKPVDVLGVAARRGPRDRPRRAVPVRGVHQAADDAGARHGRASTRATPTSPGAPPSWELEDVLHGGLPRDRRT